MSQKIIIRTGDIILHANLKDNATAKRFSEQLPFYCSGFNSGVDYCCSAVTGIDKPEDMQTGWKNGDISFGNGWFSILYGGEEQSASYKNMIIIAHIDTEDMPKIKLIPDTADFEVTLEDTEVSK